MRERMFTIYRERQTTRPFLVRFLWITLLGAILLSSSVALTIFVKTKESKATENLFLDYGNTNKESTKLQDCLGIFLDRIQEKSCLEESVFSIKDLQHVQGTYISSLRKVPLSWYHALLDPIPDTLCQKTEVRDLTKLVIATKAELQNALQLVEIHIASTQNNIRSSMSGPVFATSLVVANCNLMVVTRYAKKTAEELQTLVEKGDLSSAKTLFWEIFKAVSVIKFLGKLAQLD